MSRLLLGPRAPSPAISVLAASPFDENALLRLAASLERGSEHPPTVAIVSAAEERGSS
jgi:Cu+-exporting ATPase